jgi:hypothetical protein
MQRKGPAQASRQGPRGSVAAQIGAPRVELIDGAMDRFWLEMGFRARYRDAMRSGEREHVTAEQKTGPLHVSFACRATEHNSDRIERVARHDNRLWPR